MSQLSLVTRTGWREKAPSKADRLRELLADGRWHSQQVMERVAGMRYGARLFDLHNDADIAEGLFPVHYRKRIEGGDDSRVSYQQTDKAACDICTQEARAKPSEIIKRQAEEIIELRAELERVRRQLEAVLS